MFKGIWLSLVGWVALVLLVLAEFEVIQVPAGLNLALQYGLACCALLPVIGKLISWLRGDSSIATELSLANPLLLGVLGACLLGVAASALTRFWVSSQFDEMVAKGLAAPTGASTEAFVRAGKTLYFTVAEVTRLEWLENAPALFGLPVAALSFPFILILNPNFRRDLKEGWRLHTGGAVAG